MVVGVPQVGITVERVEPRVYRSQKHVGQRLVAVGGVGGGGAERSAGADGNRIEVVRQLLVVAPVAGIADVQNRASCEGALDVEAGVLRAVERNVAGGPHVQGGGAEHQVVAAGGA